MSVPASKRLPPAPAIRSTVVLRRPVQSPVRLRSQSWASPITRRANGAAKRRVDVAHADAELEGEVPRPGGHAVARARERARAAVRGDAPLRVELDRRAAADHDDLRLRDAVPHVEPAAHDQAREQVDRRAPAAAHPEADTAVGVEPAAGERLDGARDVLPDLDLGARGHVAHHAALAVEVLEAQVDADVGRLEPHPQGRAGRHERVDVVKGPVAEPGRDRACRVDHLDGLRARVVLRVGQEVVDEREGGIVHDARDAQVDARVVVTDARDDRPDAPLGVRAGLAEMRARRAGGRVEDLHRDPGRQRPELAERVARLARRLHGDALRPQDDVRRHRHAVPRAGEVLEEESVGGPLARLPGVRAGGEEARAQELRELRAGRPLDLDVEVGLALAGLERGEREVDDALGTRGALPQRGARGGEQVVGGDRVVVEDLDLHAGRQRLDRAVAGVLVGAGAARARRRADCRSR